MSGFSTPPPLPPASIYPANPNFSPAHMAALSEANQNFAKIRRTLFVATFDGWSVAVFAALTFVCGIGDWQVMLLGLAMGAVAYVELTAVSRLRRLNPTVIRWLWINQVALGSAIIIYAISQLLAAANGPGPFAAKIGEPALNKMVDTYGPLVNQLTQAIYFGVIAAAIFMQGGLALYYHTRGPHVQRYLEQTPAWILTMQRAGMDLR